MTMTYQYFIYVCTLNPPPPPPPKITTYLESLSDILSPDYTHIHL